MTLRVVFGQMCQAQDQPQSLAGKMLRAQQIRETGAKPEDRSYTHCVRVPRTLVGAGDIGSHLACDIGVLGAHGRLSRRLSVFLLILHLGHDFIQ